MFDRLGRSVTQRPLVVVLTWFALFVIGAVAMLTGFGQGGLFQRMTTSGSITPGTQSAKVQDLTANDGGPAITLVVKGVKLPDDLAKVAPVISDARTQFSRIDHVHQVADPLMFPNPADPRAQAMMSKNADGFVVAITLDEGLSKDAAKQAETKVLDERDTMAQKLSDAVDGASVSALSTQLIGDSITNVVEHDLVRGESIGLPVALILLIVIFGGFLAAALPLIGAICSIIIGMGLLWAVTFAMDINSFILNVISIIGLALSIDYGLLVVSRYREQIAVELEQAGYPADASQLPGRRTINGIVRDAVSATVRTAGRTVFFSALTIACSIAGLLVFNSDILRSIALGGIFVTVLAVLTAITLVPSVIVLLGKHMVRPTLLTRIPGLRRLVKMFGDSSSDEGSFSRLARFVHRIPWVIIPVVVAVMALMAWPAGDLKMRSSVIEYMPTGSEPRMAYTTLQNDYPALATPKITVVADQNAQQTADYVQHVKSSYPEVSLVTAAPLTDNPDMTKISVQMDVNDEVGQRVTDVVKDLRSYDPGYQTYVGGAAASQYDFTTSLLNGAPFALLIVAVAVMILLFLMTGSVIVPLKALIINLFSIVAALGATTWIFQGGHLGMPHVLGLETFIVACMIAFGFGLSMDYEVFLVARIKEYWDQGLSNDLAVERGLQRSGRIITSAAAIIVAVFLGFVAGQMIAIKQIGVALAIMVIADASLVRMLLVPATMTILGRWNWWAPPPLRWVYKKFHIVH